MSAVQMGGTCLWPASLRPPPAQHVFLTVLLCPVFHPSSFSSKKHMKAKTIRRDQARGSPTDQQQGCWKKGKCRVTLGNSCSLGSSLPTTAKDAEKTKFTALVGLQVPSHPTARWGWRLLQWRRNLGYGPAHFMPNCNRASTLYFDPSCKTSGIGFNFHQHYCSCCWQHSAVVLLNISTQAWRKCKISTNRGVWPPTNSFLCMCQNQTHIRADNVMTVGYQTPSRMCYTQQCMASASFGVSEGIRPVWILCRRT